MRLRQSGVTMIEVMITIVILSIGLLGLASLQMSSLRLNLSAHYHGIAAQQARDMADRMRANIRGVLSNQYDNLAGTPAPTKDCNSAAETCTPTDLRIHDLFEWNSANANLLPGGTGTVTVDASGTVFSIVLNWDDRGDAKTYSMRFQP